MQPWKIFGEWSRINYENKPSIQTSQDNLYAEASLPRKRSWSYPLQSNLQNLCLQGLANYCSVSVHPPFLMENFSFLAEYMVTQNKDYTFQSTLLLDMATKLRPLEWKEKWYMQLSGYNHKRGRQYLPFPLFSFTDSNPAS